MIKGDDLKLKEELENLAQSLDLSHFGWTSLSKPLTFDVYKDWLEEGLHGSMEYLKTHAPIKEQAQQKWPEARSAIIFAVPYYPHPEPAPLPLKKSRLSLYSQGYDYHHWFKNRLNTIISELQKLYPQEFFLAMTDSTPILERDLAYRAGLGWVGKNTCLIHPKKGSLFFLGEIITSLNMASPATPVHDFCGTCTRCIDICPTQALISPRKMDARKCIAYLTIESRDIPPEELRRSIGDWLFGCDLCQTVCPWNQKVFKNELETQELLSLSAAEEKLQVEDLRYLLTSSGKKLEKDFFGTAYSRAGSFGLKRNALIVAANRNLKELTPEIEALSTHPKLGPLAEWALTQLKS